MSKVIFIMACKQRVLITGFFLLQISILTIAQTTNLSSFGLGQYSGPEGSWCFTGQVQSGYYAATTEGCMSFNTNGTGTQSYCITTNNVGKSCTPFVQNFTWRKSNGQIILTFDAQNILVYSIAENYNRITLSKSNEMRNLVRGNCKSTFYPCGNCGGTGQICIWSGALGCIYDKCSNCLGSGKLIVHNCHD